MIYTLLDANRFIVAARCTDDPANFALPEGHVLIEHPDDFELPLFDAMYEHVGFVEPVPIEHTAISIEVKANPPAAQAATTRALRTRLLTQSDWTQLPDNPLTPEMKSQWAAYRQELRNITEAPGFPRPIMPTAPTGAIPVETP